MVGLSFTASLLDGRDGVLGLDVVNVVAGGTRLFQHLLNLLLHPLDLFLGLSFLVGLEPRLFGGQVGNYTRDIIFVGRRGDAEPEQRVQGRERQRDVVRRRNDRGRGFRRGRSARGRGSGSGGDGLLASLAFLLATGPGKSAPTLGIVSVLLEHGANRLVLFDLAEVERLDLQREDRASATPYSSHRPLPAPYSPHR
jgi:hypothetical protein